MKKNNILKDATFQIVESTIPSCVECLISYKTKDGIKHDLLFIDKKPKWTNKDYINYAKKHYKPTGTSIKASKSFKIPFVVTLATFVLSASVLGSLWGLGIIGSGGGGGGKDPTKKYNAYFYDGNQEYVDFRELNLDYGSRVYRPTNDPLKEGYDFMGWYNDSSFTNQYDFSKKLEGDETEIKIYAKFDVTMCNVTYVPSSGIVDDDNPVEVRYGYPIETAPTVKVEGAPVECVWYTTKTFDSGSEFTFGSSGTPVKEKNFTLYGKTSGTAQYHDVVLDYNDGGANEHTQSVPHNLTLTEPKINYPGHTLTNWTYVSGGEGTFTFDTPITQDIKIQANWSEDEYTITYIPNGGTITSSINKATYNGTIATAPVMTRDGYDVNQVTWWTDQACTTSQFTFGAVGTGTPVTGPTTLYAKWGTIQSVDITFDANGGYFDTTTETSKVVSTTYGQIPVAPTPKRDVTDEYTYSFKGWDKTLEPAKPISEGGTVLYTAQWDSSKNTYHVTFDANGGSITSEVSSLDVTYGETIAVADRPTVVRDGYAATTDWYDAPTGGTQFVFGTSTVTKNMTLYARWGSIKTYTVHFFDDSETPVEYTSLKETGIEYNQRAWRPVTDPTKTDYTFDGWYTTKDHTTAFDFSAPLIGEDTNINVYAKFNPIVCRVIFNPNGGTITGDDYIDVNKGNSIPSNKKPAVTSPTDMGEPTWYTDADLTNEFIFDDPTTTDVDEGTPVTDSMTLYAGYKIKAGDSFENDSWTVFLNEINGKTFAQISGADSPYHDEYNPTTGFLGLTREVVITNEAGEETSYNVVVVDQNEEAQADDDKFTFMLVTNTSVNSVKFDGASNFYPDSDLCHYVDKLSYGLPNEIKERLVLTQQTCHNPEPDQPSATMKTRLFVPSMSQVFNDTTTVIDEGAQFDIFENGDYSLMNGAWLRTPDKEAKSYAYYVNNGVATLDDITATHQVCAAFVIK